jgi:signal transduction histidine kinase
VDINVAESRQAREEAARWDVVADWLGIGCGVLLLLASASLVWWVRVRAVRPLVDLAGVMERFARGERAVRATEEGPTEVRQMGVRFNEMASALERQRAAQIAFLGGVAHDLRNPLSTVRMSVESIPPDPQLARPLAILKRQVARLDRMIGDFLDMSSIESGRLELRLARRDARELVQNTVEQFQATSPGRQIELSLPGEEIALLCDGLRIEQVTANLVSNALKYSPADAPVRVSLERADGEARLVVADHGLGIAEDDQRRLFEPFQRVGLSAEAIPGVGLGLFVVRQIVEGHGGRLSLTSAPGRGSTFRVHLPLAPPQAQPEP